MSINKSICFLVLCALVILPGQARASDIDIQTGGTRTRVDANGRISIETRRIRKVISPEQRLNSIYRDRRFYPRRASYRSDCHQNRHTYRRHQTSSSGGRVSQTYSSTSTTVCQ